MGRPRRSSPRFSSCARGGELGRCRARLVRSRRGERLSRGSRGRGSSACAAIVDRRDGWGRRGRRRRRRRRRGAVPDPTRADSCGSRCCRGTTRTAISLPKRRAPDTSPSVTSRSRTACAARTTSSCSPSRRSTTSAPRATRACAVGWSRWASSTAPTCSPTPPSRLPTDVSSTRTSSTSRRSSRRHVRQGAPRPVRRVRAVPLARRLDGDRRPDPVRLLAGEEAHDLPGEGSPDGERHLLRVGLRAARPRLRPPRRGGCRGEHEQSVVPPVGEAAQHIAQRRCGRPRPDAPSCRRRSPGISATIDADGDVRNTNEAASPTRQSSATPSPRPPERRRTCASGSGRSPCALLLLGPR